MKYILVLFSFLLYSCSTKEKELQLSETNVINLKEAISQQTEEMRLSDFVDSIVYVPMADEPLVRNRSNIDYNKPYFVVYSGKLFDTKGYYVGKVGSVGQGPGEENNGWGYSVCYDEDKDLFYTKGDKIAQFDGNRRFTGKEIQVTYRDKETGILPVGLKSPYAFVRAGKYNMLVNYPDSVYWMDENFQFVHKQRIIPEDLFLSTPGGGFLARYAFSTHNDTTLFFNCFTDELYSVKEDGLEKRWRIDLGDLKAESKYLLNELFELYEKELKRMAKTHNLGTIQKMAANSKLAEAIDGKYWVTKVYESDRYVWIAYKKLYAFEEYRNMQNKGFWAVYDKKTREIKTAPKIVNDMDGFVDITPSNYIIGINDGVLMSSVWPTSIKNHVSWRKKNNKPVDSRLEELAESIDEEDNPILIYTYLKK